MFARSFARAVELVRRKRMAQAPGMSLAPDYSQLALAQPHIVDYRESVIAHYSRRATARLRCS